VRPVRFATRPGPLGRTALRPGVDLRGWPGTAWQVNAVAGTDQVLLSACKKPPLSAGRSASTTGKWWSPAA